jgi:hypothetical protein
VQDKELYQAILRLDSPWTVSGVEWDTEGEEIRAHVDYPRGTKFRSQEVQDEQFTHPLGANGSVCDWGISHSVRYELSFDS